MSLIKRNKPLKLKNWSDGTETIDVLHSIAGGKSTCSQKVCQGSLMNTAIPTNSVVNQLRSAEEKLADAEKFLDEYYESAKRKNSEEHIRRWKEVKADVESKGYYDLRLPELAYGAKLAWRNALRCIGRIQWSKLQVFDCRHVTTPSGMYVALLNHIKYGMNNGNIRSAITVFPPRVAGREDSRMWNGQIVSFAGYTQPDGSIVGDPANVEFTEVCQKLGWKGKGGRFDILPLVFSCHGHDPEYFEIPPELVDIVKMSHPEYKWFKSLGLEWYTLPGVSNMLFDCGGMEFPAAPFNGWYMSTEIAVRDFCDPQRYNVLEEIGKKMGLDTSTPANLWKDRVALELNVAVLHSFQLSGVTIVDQYTAADSFMKHLRNENRVRRGCPGDWAWIVPPMSGSLTPVFHQEMALYYLRPSYEYQTPAWRLHKWKNAEAKPPGKSFKDIVRATVFSSALFLPALQARTVATVLYATETGKSEKFASILRDLFSHTFNARMARMDEYTMMDLRSESLVLVVVSTFGNGDPPENGETFAKELHGMKLSDGELGDKEVVSKYIPTALVKRMLSNENRKPTNSSKAENEAMDSGGPLNNLKFAVFGLGSSAYPSFAAFGKFVNSYLQDLGGERLHEIGLGDELRGQEQSFKSWAKSVYHAANRDFCIENSAGSEAADSLEADSENASDPNKLKFQLVKAEDELYKSLAKQNGKKVFPCEVLEVKPLYESGTDDGTLLVRLGTALAENYSVEIKFEPGDHLALYPENKSSIVEGVQKRLADCPEPEKPVQLMTLREKTDGKNRNEEPKTWEPIPELPQASIKTLLTRYKDITTPPTPDFLAMLAKFAENGEEKTRLETLAKDAKEYEDWRNWKYQTLSEVLEEFPSVKPPASLVIKLLPNLQPRFYSISSSQAVHPKEIHLTVGIVIYKTQGGEGPKHFGVCSTYLQNAPRGETIPAFIRYAPTFRMPADPEKPVIMVGAGTGIAPFRSFWQQRQAEINTSRADQRFGSMALYFGCRFKAWDVYDDEKTALTNNGVLAERHLGLSREPGIPKKYVQDLMQENTESIFDKIVNKFGHFYVCGDCVMAVEVYATLGKILQDLGKMSAEDAEDFLLTMKEENRYHEDIFGLTSHVPNNKR